MSTSVKGRGGDVSPRVLADAAQQAADYIETLHDVEVAAEDIEVTPELG